MAASPHPIDGIADLIIARPPRTVMGVERSWDAAPSRKFVKPGKVSVKNEIPVYKGAPRPIERVDPVRPTAPGKGIRTDALYITAGAPIAPIRFMGQAEEIRRIIVRLSLKWTEYEVGHALAVEINRFLFGETLTLNNPNPNPNDISTDENLPGSPPSDDILDFHALNSEPILSNPSNTIFYFAMNYSVDYITRPFK